MQPDASSHQQQKQLYQQQLLQQQQQQMSHFHTSMDPSAVQVHSTLPSGAPSQLPISGPPLTSSTRYANPGLTSSSRMGPPNHLGNAGSIPSFANAQQASGSASLSEHTSYFGPGAGLARLHQYSEALKEGPSLQSSEYWKTVVDEFFLPQSTLYLVLWNPGTREQKGFEVPASVVARWMQTNYLSGVVSSSMSFECPREYMSGQPFPPPPRTFRADFHLPSGNVTHFVECKRSLYLVQYDNGWQVQMNGLLRAAFVPHTRIVASTSTSDDAASVQTHLRLESLEFLVNSQRSFLPSSANVVKSLEVPIPTSVINGILAAHGHRLPDSKAEEKVGGDGQETQMVEGSLGEKEGKRDFAIKVSQVVLPESPVNEYGITLRAMRCLEITESVCQLRDLMDFTMKEQEGQRGPIEGLHRLTTQYREREGRQIMPSNALQFDPNSSLPQRSEDQAARMNHAEGQTDELAGSMALDLEAVTAEAGDGAGRPPVVPAPSPNLGASPTKRQR